MEGDEPAALSLAHGHAGIALLFHYLARVSPTAGYQELARSYLRRAFEGIRGHHVPPFLYKGLLGVAWVASHLGVEDVDSDALGIVDSLVLSQLAREKWLGHFDLITGLAGVGVYALERLPKPRAREMVAHIIRHLFNLAVRDGVGVAWITSLELQASYQRQKSRGPYYDLGLAHGVPGVIALLGRFAAAGIVDEKLTVLLDESVAWLLNEERRTEEWCFPAMRWQGSLAPPSRRGWCYGDPGIALSLLIAARGARNDDWEERALNIACASASMDPLTADVDEASLCHGSAGIAHIFNRLYQASGFPLLREAAEHWLEYTVAHEALPEPVILRRPKTAASEAFDAEGLVQNPAMWPSTPGLLYGTAGIGLSLLSAVTEEVPTWDSLFLASIPDRYPRGVGRC